MNKKYLILAIIFAVILGISIPLFFYFKTTYRRMVVVPNKIELASPTATPTPDPNHPISLLLLGYGGAGHDGPYLTDSIMLVRINPKLEKVDLISIPRDLWVSIPISTESSLSAKINLAYTIGINDKKYPNKSAEYTGLAGGGEMSKYVAFQVTGIKPDYFFALDFSGFKTIIDKIGGIDINVPRSFIDPLYPLDVDSSETCGKSEEEVKALTATMSGEKLEEQFPCRYETLTFNKGLNHFDGSTALKYARSRHSPTEGNDFSRSERQKQVIEAVKNKVLSLNFFNKIIPVSEALSYHLKTDMDLSTMEKLLIRAPDFSKYKINSIAITDKNYLLQSVSADRQSILIPKAGDGNFEEIIEFLNTSLVE